MMYETPQLETERLILKRGTYDDFVKVYEYDFTRLRNINGDFEFVKYDPKKLIGWEKAADEEPYTLDFIMFLKDNNYPIGNLVFDRYNKELNSLEISINIHPNYWRKGYGLEAILKCMDYIYNSLDIDNIVYSYAEDNFRSKGLSNKIGFLKSNESIVHYVKTDSDIKYIECIMNKDRFYQLYSDMFENRNVRI